MRYIIWLLPTKLLAYWTLIANCYCNSVMLKGVLCLLIQFLFLFGIHRYAYFAGDEGTASRIAPTKMKGQWTRSYAIIVVKQDIHSLIVHNLFKMVNFVSIQTHIKVLCIICRIIPFEFPCGPCISILQIKGLSYIPMK